MREEDGYLYLECGCIILNEKIWFHCETHYNRQPVVGDPLYRYLSDHGRAEWQKDKDKNE